jgi:hypothetical protein
MRRTNALITALFTLAALAGVLAPDATRAACDAVLYPDTCANSVDEVYLYLGDPRRRDQDFRLVQIRNGRPLLRRIWTRHASQVVGRSTRRYPPTP